MRLSALYLLFGTALACAHAPDLARCADLAKDAARLACYDDLARPAATPTAAVESAQATDEFGMNETVAARSGDRRDSRAPESITETVTAIRKLAYGQLVLNLENGQIWQQINRNKGLQVKVGDAVTIKRGALGAYRLKARGNKAYKVRRVQ